MKRQATRPIPIDKTKIRSLAKRVTDAWLNIVKRDRGNSDPVYYMRGADHIMNPPMVEKYMTKDVKGALVRTPIYITSEFDPKFNSTRFYVYGGFVRSWGYGRQNTFKESVTIQFNSARTADEIFENKDRVLKEVYSVLIHEITHLRDILYKHESYHDDPKKYHNAPHELRAFMQQIADEVIDFFPSDGWVTRRSFEAALDQSPTWDRIKRELNPQNRKLMFKGIYRALQDVGLNF